MYFKLKKIKHIQMCIKFQVLKDNNRASILYKILYKEELVK